LRFTGKERDAESGLDYFGARYFSGAQGRFTGADRYSAMLSKQNMEAAGIPAPMAASFFNGYLENPQNWNQYAYVRNNPLRFTDPTGAAPAEGHHLISGFRNLTSPLAKDFADAIKTGPLSGNGYPNQPGFNGPHREYNGAVEEILQNAEQTAGDRNTWSLKQWKDVAKQILNSEEPTIKDFLDELEENNPGAKAALSGALAAYRVSLSVAARMIAADLAAELTTFLRMPLIVVVDTGVTNQEKRIQEDINKKARKCLISRETGQCMD
jgi:RHS repeat-associated protein